MEWQIFAWSRLADAAAGGLIVLAAGSLAARFCRQPVRRVRLVVLTLLGGLAVPCLGALPAVPRWSAGILPPPSPRQARADADAPMVSTSRLDSSDPAGTRGDRAFAGRLEAAPTGTSSTEIAFAPSERAGSSLDPGRGLPAARPLLLACYLGAAVGLAAWWLVGQVMLWRVTRSARPVPGAVRDVFLGIAGPEGGRVVLLESDRICLPFTYTWIRPVILLPSSFCDGWEPGVLRYVLAHEWSHVERRDAWAWNLSCLAGLVLFYQPLFWWLRRQLRLCQDYLADARAAEAGSAEDYAAFLVRLARSRRPGRSLPALGIGDRPSNLYRRVMMLVQDHEPLERRCRTAWTTAVASAAAAVIVAASGLHLSAAPPARPGAKEEKPVQAQAKKAEEPKPAGETLHYTGMVVDKETDRPIVGAKVVVRRSAYKSEVNRVIEESKHTTDSEGKYAFTIPPEQVAEPALYIELDVEHPDYATRAQFGYSLGMTRKNEKLNERPFFERIEMRPAQPVSGRVETPDGDPAAGVEILAYSRTDKNTPGSFEYGSFARAKTDADGRFRLPITTPGKGAYWILPKAYALELHVLPDGKRGDLGTFVLKKGVAVSGRALDVKGKPLAHLLVEADRERGGGADAEALGQMAVSDAIRRTTETDAEGRFTFDPLPSGTYRIAPTEVEMKGDRSAGWTRREIPGVFAPKKLTIKDDETYDPLELRASPVVVIEGRWVDSKGQPKSGWGSFVFGKLDGSSWNSMARPDEKGLFTLKVPHGLEDVQLDIMTNEHNTTRHRVGKDAPLVEGRNLMLGTLDHDVKDIEIVRYVSPIVIINATTKDGKPVKDFKATVEYAGETSSLDKRVSVVGGGKKQSIQDEQYDGRYRTSQLLPDREVKVEVKAEGFASATRTLSLPEGKTEEVDFVLEPK